MNFYPNIIHPLFFCAGASFRYFRKDRTGVSNLFVLDLSDTSNTQDPRDGRTSLMTAVLDNDEVNVKRPLYPCLSYQDGAIKLLRQHDQAVSPLVDYTLNFRHVVYYLVFQWTCLSGPSRLQPVHLNSNTVFGIIQSLFSWSDALFLPRFWWSGYSQKA